MDNTAPFSSLTRQSFESTNYYSSANADLVATCHSDTVLGRGMTELETMDPRISATVLLLVFVVFAMLIMFIFVVVAGFAIIYSMINSSMKAHRI